VRHAAWRVGALRAMLGHCTSGGLPLPQAKGPSTVARLVIHFEPESHSRGSGSFVVRGGGGSQKVVVALLGVDTASKNSPSISGIQAYIA
jgi:hypothetical protein